MMVERSYNGWRASPNLSSLDAGRFTVPGVPDRWFTTVTVAAPLFKYLIRRFHAEVDPLTGGVLDEWSYNYRKARAADALSCHASATAVDLDATQFPMGRANMTQAQRAAVERILAQCKGQFRWGGWFNQPYVDEMHFELAKGTSPQSVEWAIKGMGLYPDGRVIHPVDLQAGADPGKVRLVKKALAAVDLYSKKPVYNGNWNKGVEAAWAVWRSRKPKEAKQLRIDALGNKAGMF